jgi:hypothetical protein
VRKAPRLDGGASTRNGIAATPGEAVGLLTLDFVSGETLSATRISIRVPSSSRNQIPESSTACAGAGSLATRRARKRSWNVGTSSANAPNER